MRGVTSQSIVSKCCPLTSKQVHSCFQEFLHCSVAFSTTRSEPRQTSTKSLVRLSQVIWLLVHALLHAAPNLLG